VQSTLSNPPSAPLFSGRWLVAENVERGRIDDPTGEVGAVSREALDHERLVGDFRMRGDEAERARPLEAEARIVGGNALVHDRGLAPSSSSATAAPPAALLSSTRLESEATFEQFDRRKQARPPREKALLPAPHPSPGPIRA
jgi:hypothetical protein